MTFAATEAPRTVALRDEAGKLVGFELHYTFSNGATYKRPCVDMGMVQHYLRIYAGDARGATPREMWRR